MEKKIVNAFLGLKETLKVQAWVIESAFVLTILLATAIVSGKGWIEYLAVLAVYFTFKHASVSERLREANEANAKKATAETTSCAHKLQQFFILKEILWVAFFVLSGAWSALAGCGIFFLYAWWRAAYRRHHPRAAKPSSEPIRLFYRHFKYSDNDGLNGCYELLHIAEFTETGEKMVVYRPCYKLPNMFESDAVTALIRTDANFSEPRSTPIEGHDVVERFRLIEDEAMIFACISATDALYK
jgi:hypothetical protein